MSLRMDRTEYWRQLLENFLVSGLKAEEYAKQHKVSRASLYKWRRRLMIPLNENRKEFCEHQEQPLSFIEMKEVCAVPPILQMYLKLELCGKGGTAIKAELTAGWEQVADLLKVLAA